MEWFKMFSIFDMLDKKQITYFFKDIIDEDRRVSGETDSHNDELLEGLSERTLEEIDDL